MGHRAGGQHILPAAFHAGRSRRESLAGIHPGLRKVGRAAFILPPGNRGEKGVLSIVGDASCYTLAHLEAESLIAVGTTISAGSGTQPRVDEAVLFLFDYEEEEKVWEGTPDPPVKIFNALVAVRTGGFSGRSAATNGDPSFSCSTPGRGRLRTGSPRRTAARWITGCSWVPTG